MEWEQNYLPETADFCGHLRFCCGFVEQIDEVEDGQF